MPGSKACARRIQTGIAVLSCSLNLASTPAASDKPSPEAPIMTTEKRVLSGVQPTGNLHLGNYLGAIVKFVELQKEAQCLYCVVDMHAITVWQDPDELRNNTREIAAAFIAAGIDPEKHIIFNQSRVPQHAELGWICNCIARIG